ncbi:MAG: hypothetical protein ACUVWY_09475 [Desulfosoma sp.]|uniref:hypothetical protein n=1 Tax=Desulfosoma sp. TaxID=2603217 RepID=UPI004049C464
MAELVRGQRLVRVQDRAGNEFYCPLEALKNPADLDAELLESCVDDATVGRYAGDFQKKEA